MRGSKEDVPTTLEAEEVVIQEAEWADIHVGFETYNQEFDLAPLLKGLPDDRCQCPHYGYVLKGRMTVRYADREEVINAGDAYYMVPGHAPVMEAGTEIVEFSPRTSSARLWRSPSATSPRCSKATKAKTVCQMGADTAIVRSRTPAFSLLPHHSRPGIPDR